MSFTERFSEGAAVLAGLHSANRAAGNHNTAWVDMENYHRAVVLIDVGAMTQGATFDLILQEATDATGAGAQAIAGKAVTQLTQAGGDGNDWLMVELRSEEMDENNAYKFIRAQLTIANANVQCSVWVLGIVGRYPPVPLTNVTEVID